MTRRLLVLGWLDNRADARPTLAESLRAVAVHRGAADPEGLHRALIDLATAALHWADDLTTGGPDVRGRPTSIDA